ncbi:hypothetical protein [Stenotrophomonas sp. S39]|uniref:hypothetical protein n=1 Tax=Stenotrophomonas sp. S39 TaxID=2767451 RepID=UPI00190BD86C|nr:hypothetical protein [Stenotrophomonas sp. S39]
MAWIYRTGTITVDGFLLEATMALTRKGKYWYGDEDGDIAAVIGNYSRAAGYPATLFRAALCSCGSARFHLFDDEVEGAARRDCVACGESHLMFDSAEYLAEANLDEHVCMCDNAALSIHCGVALYEGTQDVQWLYIGCRCAECGMVGVYADWKCEGGPVEAFMERV